MGLISRVSSRTYRGVYFFHQKLFKKPAKMAQEMGQQIDIRSLSPQQIEQLRQQVNNEITTLSSAVQNYELVMSRFVEARNTLKQIDDQPHAEGQEIMVPVTQSMYVPGKLKDANKILIDVGTGYFVERTRGDADDFCKRKIELVQKEIEKLAPVLRARYESKQAIDETIANLNATMEKRQAAAQAQ